MFVCNLYKNSLHVKRGDIKHTNVLTKLLLWVTGIVLFSKWDIKHVAMLYERVFFCSKTFNFERTWWRLFQKQVECTSFDIYVLIN